CTLGLVPNTRFAVYSEREQLLCRCSTSESPESATIPWLPWKLAATGAAALAVDFRCRECTRNLAATRARSDHERSFHLGCCCACRVRSRAICCSTVKFTVCVVAGVVAPGSSVLPQASRAPRTRIDTFRFEVIDRPHEVGCSDGPAQTSKR